MKALIMMLFNLKEQTYHPIFYFEHPFSSQPDNTFRFKSKGHRTNGFKDKEKALQSIEIEIVSQVKKMGYTLYKELETDLPWDGENVPADNQLRDKAWVERQEEVTV